MSTIDAHATLALASWSVGDVLDRLLNTVTRRIAFAFGLVLAVAFLGAIAFGAATDIRVIWFDERGHPAVGVVRSDTQTRLDQALRDLAEARKALAAAKAQRPAQEYGTATKQQDEQTAQRLRESEQQLQLAHEKIAHQSKSLALFERQEKKLRTEFQERQVAHEQALAGLQAMLDQSNRQLNEFALAAPKLNSYSVARIGDQAYLPLRDRPERAARTS